MKSARTSRAVLLILTLTAMVAAGSVVDVVAAPSSALAAPGDAICSTNDDDPGLATFSPEGDERCVAGRKFNTRALLLDECLEGPLAPANFSGPYTPKMCGGGGLPTASNVEFIAQARLIARVSARLGAFDGISPDLQWEMSSPRIFDDPTKKSTAGRVDLVHYDHASPSGPIHLYELKLTANPDRTNVTQQLDNYLRGLNAVFNPSLDPQTNRVRAGGWQQLEADDGAWVSDLFTVDAVCASGTTGVQQYSTFLGDVAGLILVAPVGPAPCEGEAPGASESGADTGDGVAGDVVINAIPRTGPDSGFTSIPEAPPVPGGEEVCFFWVCVDENGVITLNLPEDWVDQLLDWLSEENIDRAARNPRLWTYIVNRVVVGGLMRAASGSAVGIGAQVGWWAGTKLSNALGDPHLFTFDNRAYDLQSVGEFTLMRNDEFGLNVQARTRAPFAGSSVSVMGAYAFDLNGHRIQISPGTTSPLLVDGTTLNLANGEFRSFGAGAGIARGNGTSFMVVWPGASDRPTAYMYGDNSLKFYVPEWMPTVGLMGNNNGDPTDDLAYADGTPLGANPTAATLHGPYADSWRVTDSTSLFSYGPGLSTDDFTDRSFPVDGPSQLSDYGTADIAAATVECQAAGVAPGFLLDSCTLDRLVAGDDRFTASAASTGTVAVGTDALGPDTAGTVLQDFEGPVPSNFRPIREDATPGNGTSAGPFLNESYDVTIPVPAHDGASLSFDLIALGIWEGNGATESVTVEAAGQTTGVSFADCAAGGLNPQTTGPGSPTVGAASASGTLPDGRPYSVYPVSMQLGGHADVEHIRWTFTGMSGLSARAAAVDNIRFDYNLVAPEQFTAPTTALYDGRLAIPADFTQSGAGNLEGVAATDVYTFTLPATADGLQLQWASGPAEYPLVDWQLLDASGTSVAGGGTTAPRRLEDLPPGTYQLKIEPEDDLSVGAYALDVLAVFPPGSGTLTLPAQVSAGVPFSGAGNLSTAADRDEYLFTVPAGGQQVLLDWISGPGGQPYVYWDLQNTADDTTVASGMDAARDGAFLLTTGNYRLTITPMNGLSGDYAFGLLTRNDETFTSTLPLTIPHASLPAGAGNLETAASSDAYTFTVPATVTDLFIDWDTGPAGAPLVDWTLVRDSTAEVIAGNWQTQDRTVAGLQPGTYTLRVAPFDSTRTGTYALTVRDASEQRFTLTLPARITPDLPSNGAGRLETAAARDVYAFTVPQGSGPLYLDWSTVQGGLGQAEWQIVDLATNTAITSGIQIGDSFDLKNLTLAPGNYELRLAPFYNQTGPYSFTLFVKAAQTTSAVSLPAAIGPHAPAIDIGFLSQGGDVDNIDFTIAQNGQSLNLDWLTSPGILDWSLTQVATGSTVASSIWPDDTFVTALTAGPYRLRVTTYSGDFTGGYSLNITPTTANLAPSATVTASSETVPGGPATNATDNIATSSSEWITQGGRDGSWIQLNWTTPVTINTVVLHDRPNLNDQVFGGTLTFADGTTANVGRLIDNGSATVIQFPPVTTTSLRFTITSVWGGTTNIGLAEIRSYG